MAMLTIVCSAPTPVVASVGFGAAGRQNVAASVSTRERQKADFQCDGRAGQGQLAATPGETR